MIFLSRFVAGKCADPDGKEREEKNKANEKEEEKVILEVDERCYNYEEGSDEKSLERLEVGGWPTRGRSGETIRQSNDLVLRREEHRKFLQNLNLPQEEIDIRLTNWDELVQEVTFGGDRSRAHTGGRGFNRKSRTRRRFSG